MPLIHEKIVALLLQRKLKKRDLAKALGISPQTATDICKGRSAITLPHLRNLVAYFGVRADFWIDDQQLLPESADRVGNNQSDACHRSGLAQLADLDGLLQRLRSFLADHKDAFTARNPGLSSDDLRVLGLLEITKDSVGRNCDSAEGA